MSGTTGAFTGRDVIAYFSLSQDNTVVPNDYVRLGSVRNKEWGPEWDTADVTADDSPELQRENLVTFQSNNISLSGISRTEEIKNQDELEDYINDPINNQPCGWIRLVRPSNYQGATTKIYDIPVQFTSFRQTGPYEDGVSWTLEAPSNGKTVINYA